MNEIKIQVKPRKKDVDIVQLLADDNRAATVAERLNRTTSQVYQDFESIKKRYGCKTLEGVVALFFRNGLVN